MARAGAGDQAARRALYERHQEFVFRAAFRFTGNEADARDLAQDVFVALFSRVHRYAAQGRFTTYLWRVVANRFLNEREKTRRHVEVPDAVAVLSALPDAPERSPEREAERRETDQRVREAILALPERQRLAVVLSRFEGLDYEGIASALGCSVSSVESLLFRAREKLARALAAP